MDLTNYLFRRFKKNMLPELFEPIKKDNLRQFLYEKGTLLARPLECELTEDEVFVCYYEGACIIEKEDIGELTTGRDRIYKVNKKDF